MADVTPRAPAGTLAYRSVDTPVGPILLAATDRGLARVAFLADRLAATPAKRADLALARDAAPETWQTTARAVASELGALLTVPARALPEIFDPLVRQLEEYFTGQRHAFDTQVDCALSRGFQAKVHQWLQTIPYGKTVRYADVARGVGAPRAFRAVGTACGANPVPIVVPCHRVIRTDGSLGGYASGLPIKRWLLDLEERGSDEAGVR